MEKQNYQQVKAKNLEKQKNKENLKQAKEQQKNQKLLVRERKKLDFQNNYCLERNKIIEGKIKKLQVIFKNKQAILKNKYNTLNANILKAKKAKLNKSFLLRYYQWRKDLSSKIINQKQAKIKAKLTISKITNEKSALLLSELENIAKITNNYYLKKIKGIENKVPDQKLKIAQQKLQINYRQKVNNLKNLKEQMIPANFYQVIKDKIALFKLTTIKNKNLSQYSEIISTHLRNHSMYYILGFIIFIFGLQTNWANLEASQFMIIIQNNTYILIIGMAMLLVIVGGYIDLSVGALMGFIGAISVKTYNQLGGNFVLTLIITILLGLAIGLVQGVLIGYFKMPAFIVTLGSMLLFQGLVLTVTESKSLIPLADQHGNSSYLQFVRGIIPDYKVNNINLISLLVIVFFGLMTIFLLIQGRNKKIKYGVDQQSSIAFSLKIAFTALLFGVLAYYVAVLEIGMRYYLLYIIILVVVFIFITQNTAFGRNIYALGGNKKAAKLSGINCERTTTYIFALTGVMVAFAAIIFTGIVTNAGPLVASQGYELDIISSVFVGGASMAGGVGTIQGSLIGGLILGYINNGMVLLNFQADLQKIVKAIVLLLAVGYDIYSHRKIN